VLEFYDQPPAIKLVYQAKNGRQVGVWHTPDYFVLRADGIGWEEWKTDAGLERLSQIMPHRYRRDAVGHRRCPPGERFAAQFGLLYRLRSSSEIDWVLQRNLRFLNDYLIKPPPVDQCTAETVLSRIKERPGVQLAALIDTPGEAHADDIYTLIASGRIYVDLRAAALAEPERVRLFRDQETASAYAMVDKARKIDGGTVPQLLAESSPADLREAHRRHAIITPYLAEWPIRPRQHPRGRFGVGWRSGDSLNRATGAATSDSFPNGGNAETASTNSQRRRWRLLMSC
jgi:hypothetical protein